VLCGVCVVCVCVCCVCVCGVGGVCVCVCVGVRCVVCVCGKFIKYSQEARRNKTHRSEDCPTVCAELSLQTQTLCLPALQYTRGLVLRDFALLRLEN